MTSLPAGHLFFRKEKQVSRRCIERDGSQMQMQKGAAKAPFVFFRDARMIT
jgi:hypothetical protein